MKKLIISPVLIGVGIFLCVGSAAFAANALKTEQDKLSYSLGAMTGKAFKDHQVQINPAVFDRGLNDGYLNHKTALTDEEIHQTVAAFQQQSLLKMQAKMKQSLLENTKREQTFLAENKNKPGIKVTADGLQYEVLKQGNGSSPTLHDTVTVNYEGRLLDGKVFDSSYQRGKPATFPVNAVIKGWQEALTMMKPGDEWNLYIPAALAYGEQGAPGVIGPMETLVFKVALLSVQQASAQKK